jgi:hypothetical protein
MKTFRRCAREHHYSYELGYRALFEDAVLRFGSLVHLGLEAWWCAVINRLEAAYAAMQGEADPYDRERAYAMLAGYDVRWSDEPYDVIAVELEFRAPLVNPETGAASRTYELAGKLDVLVRDRRDALTYKVEHKTSSEDIGVGSTYWKRLTLDPQISTYYEGARSLGYDPAGCLYDVLGKPGLRPSAVPLVDADGVKIVHDASGERVRTKDGKKWRQTGDAELGYVLQTRPETPEEFGQRLRDAIAGEPDRYYQRGTIVRLEADEREAAFDRWHTARLIREAQLAGRHPRNPDGCIRYNRTCSFFEVCCGTASLEDTTLFRRVRNVHEELSNDNVTKAA